MPPISPAAYVQAVLDTAPEPHERPYLAAVCGAVRRLSHGSAHGAIEQAAQRLLAGDALADAEATALFRTLLDGSVAPELVGTLLLVLRPDALPAATLAAFAGVLRDAATPVTPRLPADAVLLDTCGTGGDGLGTFNVSTTIIFVLAADGIRIAKHGNRAITSRAGSADVLEALGVAVDLDAAGVARAIETVGIGFMLAPRFHPALRHVQDARRRLAAEMPFGIETRTVFNVLGPLANPARVPRQVVGVYDPALVPTLAEVLRRLGLERALVVHGAGLDELSTAGPSVVAELAGGSVHERTVTPEEVGLPRVADQRAWAGGDAPENAAILRRILSGAESAPRRDLTLLNAGAGLYVAGRVASIAAGVGRARELIASGAALEKLQELVRASATLRGR